MIRAIDIDSNHTVNWSEHWFYVITMTWDDSISDTAEDEPVVAGAFPEPYIFPLTPYYGVYVKERNSRLIKRKRIDDF
jgi:hypothetical protein